MSDPPRRGIHFSNGKTEGPDPPPTRVGYALGKSRGVKINRSSHILNRNNKRYRLNPSRGNFYEPKNKSDIISLLAKGHGHDVFSPESSTNPHGKMTNAQFNAFMLHEFVENNDDSGINSRKMNSRPIWANRSGPKKSYPNRITGKRPRNNENSNNRITKKNRPSRKARKTRRGGVRGGSGVSRRA